MGLESGTCLLSWDFTQGDVGFVLIGVKRPGDTVEIINVLQGKEAKDLVKKVLSQGDEE